MTAPTARRRPGRPYAVETIIEANEGLALAEQGHHGARQVRTLLRVALPGLTLSRQGVKRSFDTDILNAPTLRALLRNKGYLLPSNAASATTPDSPSILKEVA